VAAKPPFSPHPTMKIEILGGRASRDLNSYNSFLCLAANW
jgi:hypothetical protein